MALPPEAAPAGTEPTYKALLIGNAEFPEDPHNLPRLVGPPHDIALVRDALCSAERGLFEPTNVRTIVDGTKHDVATAMEEFFRGARREDRLLLYYSGHGKQDEYDNLFLCLRDTRTDLLVSTGMSDGEVNGMMRASDARTFVIVLDCCQSGAFKGGGLPPSLCGTGRFLLASSRRTEASRDAATADGPSAFTRHFVDALRVGPDPNRDGYISLRDAYEYVLERLRAETRQIPVFDVDRAVGDVALARSGPRQGRVRLVTAESPAFGVSPAELDFGVLAAGEPAQARTLVLSARLDETIAVHAEADDPRILVSPAGFEIHVAIDTAAAGAIAGAVQLSAAGVWLEVPVRARVVAATVDEARVADDVEPWGAVEAEPETEFRPEPERVPVGAVPAKGAAVTIHVARPPRRGAIAAVLVLVVTAMAGGALALTRRGGGEAAGTSTAAAGSTPAAGATAAAPAVAALPPVDDDAFAIESSPEVYASDPRGSLTWASPDGPRTIAVPAPPRSLAGADYGVLVGTDRGALWRPYGLGGTWHTLTTDPTPLVYSDGGVPTAIVVLRAGVYRVCGLDPQGAGPLRCSAPLGFTPRGLGVASENTKLDLYVVPQGVGDILVVDDAALRTYDLGADAVTPLETIPLPRGAHGTPIPFGGRIYVAVANGIAVVDPARGDAVRTIPLVATPAAIWIVPVKGGLLYAALPTRNEVRRIPLDPAVGKPSVWNRAVRPVALAGSAVAGSAENAIYVANAGDRSVWRLDPLRRAHPACVIRAGRAC